MSLAITPLCTIFQEAVDQDLQLSTNIFLNIFHAKLVAAESQKHLPSFLPLSFSASHRKPDFDFLIVGYSTSRIAKHKSMRGKSSRSEREQSYKNLF